MKVTGAYWRRGALGVFLAVFSVLAGRVLLFGGVVGIGAWLLTKQYTYVRRVAELQSALTVTVSLAQSHTITDEQVPVTLTVETDEAVPDAIEVTGSVPTAANGPDHQSRTLRLAPGNRVASTSYTVSCPVAGRHEFEAPSVTVFDPEGLFESTFTAGPSVELVTEPRHSRTLREGRGGRRQSSAYSEDTVGRNSTAGVPETIRKYVFGDPVGRIDWNSTARLGTTHVKQLEADPTPQISLVVDHRMSMGHGLPGGTKFEFARQVALSYVRAAQETNVPLALYAVGQRGMTHSRPTSRGRDHLRAIRLTLFDLEPESVRSDRFDDSSHPSMTFLSRAASLVAADDSEFGRTLRPFLEHLDKRGDPFENDPLLNTVRTVNTRTNGSSTTVIVTDDSKRAEVRQAVHSGRRRNGRVVALLSPTVLFERGGLSDLDAAYERYQEFDEFRRNLDNMDRVSAIEYGPGERRGALLSTATSARRAEARNTVSRRRGRRRRGRTRRGDTFRRRRHERTLSSLWPRSLSGIRRPTRGVCFRPDRRRCPGQSISVARVARCGRNRHAVTAVRFPRRWGGIASVSELDYVRAGCPRGTLDSRYPGRRRAVDWRDSDYRSDCARGVHALPVRTGRYRSDPT